MYPGVLLQLQSAISPEGQAQQPLSGEFGIHTQGKPNPGAEQKQSRGILLGHSGPGGIGSHFPFFNTLPRGHVHLPFSQEVPG
jgi:hypothetical protein